MLRISILRPYSAGEAAGDEPKTFDTSDPEEKAAAEATIAELKAEGRSVLDAEGNQVQQVPEEGELVALLPMEGG